jgi:hypothetical protein
MRWTLWVVGFVVLVAGANTRAHHSYAGFDQDRTVSVGGTIEKIVFGNPHVVLTLRTKDSTVYTVTWMSGRQLNNQGVATDELRVGDVVVVSGSPSRESAELSKISEVRRLSDGWTWRMDNGRVNVISAK